MLDFHQLLTRLGKLDRNAFEPAVVTRLKDLEVKIQEVQLGSVLAENEILIKLIKIYRQQIEEINLSLQTRYSDELTDRKRDNLLDKKMMLENFIRPFDSSSAEAQLKEISDEIDYYEQP